MQSQPFESAAVQPAGNPVTLSSILLSTPEVKIRVLGYARNGNDLVTRRAAAHHVAGNAYLFTTTNEYGETFGTLCAMLPSGQAVEIQKGIDLPTMDAEAVWCGADDRKPIIDACLYLCRHYVSESAILSHLDSLVETGAFLRSLDLRVASDFLPAGDPRLLRYQAHREQMLAKQQEIAMERQRQAREEEERVRKAEKERQAAARAELRAKLLAARGEVPVDPRVLLDLSDRLGIPCPIRLRGWIIQRLVSLTFKEAGVVSCRFRRTSKKQNGSASFYLYIAALLNSLKLSPDD